MTQENESVKVFTAPEIVAHIYTQMQRAEKYMKASGDEVFKDYYDREELKSAISMLKMVTERLVIKNGGCV